MFWKKEKDNKVMKELNQKIDEQKESYIASYLTLICRKKYDDTWDNENEVKVITSLLKLHPDVYEAFYEHAYQKLSQFLNEDGTGNRQCEFWKEML